MISNALSNCFDRPTSQKLAVLWNWTRFRNCLYECAKLWAWNSNKSSFRRHHLLSYIKTEIRSNFLRNVRAVDVRCVFLRTACGAFSVVGTWQLKEESITMHVFFFKWAKLCVGRFSVSERKRQDDNQKRRRRHSTIGISTGTRHTHREREIGLNSSIVQSKLNLSQSGDESWRK